MPHTNEKKKISEEQSIILDLLFQGAYITEKKTIWEIYCGGLSAYERATSYLVSQKVIKHKRGGQVYSIKKGNL